MSVFDRVAHAYNAFMKFWGLFRPEELEGLRSWHKDEILCDIGGGTGFYSRYFADKGHRVYLADESRAMLEKAGEHTRVTVYQAKAESLPLGDQSCDVVLYCDVLHHLRDLDTVLREAWRILKPGGTVLVYDFHKNHPFTLLLLIFETFMFGRVRYFDPLELSAAFRSRGFLLSDLREKGSYFLASYRKGGQ